MLSDLPAADVVLLAVALALAALLIAALAALIRERRRNTLLSAALENLVQGVSMYDGRARLVLCNNRYIEMSILPPENFRPGTPLREILVRRAKIGAFAGDPDEYVDGALRQAASGRTEEKTFELEDGRTISVITRPLADGGWVSTHTDVSQQRAAEKERDSLRQREQHRGGSPGDPGVQMMFGEPVARISESLSLASQIDAVVQRLGRGRARRNRDQVKDIERSRHDA